MFLFVLLCLVWKPASLSAQTPAFQHFETNVAPLPGEDIDGPCHYTFALPAGKEAIRAIWIIFDRGRDIHDLASDPDTLAFAQRFHLGLLLQSHCPGKRAEDRGDMNMDPSAGLGPALLRSLDHFAEDSSHPELRRVPFILLGFSGAGPLSARLVNSYPQRTIAAILSAPGHFSPQGIDTVSLSEPAQTVPQLILAGGADDRSGTQLPYDYFLRYRRLDAPWTFVLQNNSPHCCTANEKALMLAWLTEVVTRRLPRTPNEPLRRINQRDDWQGSIETEQTSIRDSFGHKTFNAVRASIGPASDQARNASWLPNAVVASAWLAFVQQEHHPILPLR
jgi:pimeloyl-ACP methyl ester carboxylesterase